jgi:hypothetical protein
VTHRDADAWGPSFGNTDSLRNLATKLMQIDNDRPRDQLQAKYLEASKILSGQAFERGKAPFQEFNALVQLRDALVHPRHQDETDQAGYISPRLRVVRDLQQRGLTHTRGRRPGDIPGGMSWLNELETLDVATWAYQAAVGIVKAVGDMLPRGQTATPGIEILNDMVAQLPAR